MYFTVRLSKRLVFAAVTVALVLGVLEAGARFYEWRRETRKPPSPLTFRNETTTGVPISDGRGALVAHLHPTRLYAMVPNQDSGKVTVNGHGFRGRDWSKKKPPGTVRVAVLGGSAAFGYWLEDAHVLAAQLEPRLRALAPPGRAVEVLNFATVGYDSAQELILLATEAIDHSPDAIVLFDGWNDYANARWIPKDRPNRHAFFCQLETAVERGHEPGKNLLRCSAFFRAMERRARKWREQKGPARAPGDLTDHPDGAPRYREGLERMCRLAKGYGIAVVMVSQPELFQRADPVPPEEQKLRASAEPGSAEYARAVYPIYVGVAKEVATAEGVRYVDCSHPFDGLGEAVFMDEVHLNERGNALIAERLAPVIAETLGLGSR